MPASTIWTAIAAMRTSLTVVMSEAATKGMTAVTMPKGTARAAYISAKNLSPALISCDLLMIRGWKTTSSDDTVLIVAAKALRT